MSRTEKEAEEEEEEEEGEEGRAGGLGLHRTASVGVTAGCRRWCTTHHPPTHKQKPPAR